MKYFLTEYCIGLVVFSVFRFILLLFHLNEVNNNNTDMLITALLKGIQFDSIIMTYILTIPILVALLTSIFSRAVIGILVAKYLIRTSMFISIFIITADIPYFNYNSGRLTSVIFNWSSNYGMVTKMIFQDKSNFIFIALFLIIYSCYFFISTLNWSTKIELSDKNSELNLFNKQNIFFTILALGLMILGLRGRIDSPLKISHAFFCNNLFYNQLGLNPIFSLFKSLAEGQKLSLINEKESIDYTKGIFQIGDTSHFNSPIARRFTPNEPSIRPNIIMVIMESMSAEKMGIFGNEFNMTPFLDSLSHHAINFTKMYSAGRHTYNGIFSSLYSYPAILSEHPMTDLIVKQYNGMPTVLQSKNYHSIFFTTHFPSFDNMGSFLLGNSFDEMVSEHDYPTHEKHGVFGVPDHAMFEFGIEKLNKLSQSSNPFFATFMTTSDHPPYNLPNDIAFKPSQQEMWQKMVAYADWSIQRFVSTCSNQPWFNNTVFIFVADHGSNIGQNSFDIPLSYHHIPCIMYCPDSSIIKPKIMSGMSCQIDIFPTIMDLLHIPYVNNTLGVSLFQTNRKYAYFSSDDRIGCIDSEFLYTYNLNGNEGLYHYKNLQSENCIHEYRSQANEMKTYALSMIKTGKWLMDHGKTMPESIK